MSGHAHVDYHVRHNICADLAFAVSNTVESKDFGHEASCVQMLANPGVGAETAHENCRGERCANKELSAFHGAELSLQVHAAEDQGWRSPRNVEKLITCKERLERREKSALALVQKVGIEVSLLHKVGGNVAHCVSDTHEREEETT